MTKEQIVEYVYHKGNGEVLMESFKKAFKEEIALARNFSREIIADIFEASGRYDLMRRKNIPLPERLQERIFLKCLNVYLKQYGLKIMAGKNEYELRLYAIR